ncbi:MAG: TRAP transporter large permease [Rhodospirillales bacterium]
MTSVLTGLNRAVGGLAALLLAGLVASLLAGILSRYTSGLSLVGAGTAAQWLFAAMIATALPLSRLATGHLAVCLYRPENAGPVAVICAEAVTLFALLTLLTGAGTLIGTIGGVDPSLDLPVWVRFALIPLMAALALPLGLMQDMAAARNLWPRLTGIALGILLWLAGRDLPGITALSPLAALGAGFVVALATGAPVAIAMLFAAMLAHLAGGLMPPPATTQTMINGATRHLLLAAPLFITAGALMNAGSLTDRLIALATSLVGHLRGGLAQVTVLTSTLFAGVSGSSYAEAAISAKLLAPQMRKRGYPAADAGAITAAASVLPNVIPPSVALLILAGVANLSVGALWIAGILPGLLLTAFLMVTVSILARRRRYPRGDARPPIPEIIRRAGQAAPVLMLAVLIVGGIRFGIVTPTEAGVVAILYALFLGVCVYRAYRPAALVQIFREAGIQSAQIGLLIGAASPFAFVMVAEQAPQMLSTAAFGLTDNPLLLLILANLILLAFGMILDIGAAILILTPILMPIAVSAGIDPIHFGVVIVVNLMIGGLTPPVGMLVFITSGLTGTPVRNLFRAVLPYIAALLLALLTILLIPALTTSPGWIFRTV